MYDAKASIATLTKIVPFSTQLECGTSSEAAREWGSDTWLYICASLCFRG